jgi:hypothetical protein
MSEELNNDQQSGVGDETPNFDGAADTSFLTEEAKKPLNRTSVVLFVLMALGSGALYYMHLRTGPTAASAATVSANTTINQFLNGGESNVVQMQRMLRETEKVVQQFLAYPSVPQIPLTDLHTNPFRQLAAKGPGESVSDAEAKRRKEEERQAVLKAVQGLQLQSVMRSTAHTACMINNVMYREGQQIDGFTIEKINTNAVVVRNGTYRFELKMQR